MIEMRLDKLSYLIDVEGKILVRARHMFRPAKKGEVPFASQVHVQGRAQVESKVGVLPRRSGRLKEKKDLKNLTASSCTFPTMTPPSSGNTGDSTYWIANKLPKRCRLSLSPTRSGKMLGGFPSSRVQWASFADCALAIFLVAIIALAVII